MRWAQPRAALQASAALAACLQALCPPGAPRPEMYPSLARYARLLDRHRLYEAAGRDAADAGADSRGSADATGTMLHSVVVETVPVTDPAGARPCRPTLEVLCDGAPALLPRRHGSNGPREYRPGAAAMRFEGFAVPLHGDVVITVRPTLPSAAAPAAASRCEIRLSVRMKVEEVEGKPPPLLFGGWWCIWSHSERGE